jgi:hypothetical protein
MAAPRIPNPPPAFTGDRELDGYLYARTPARAKSTFVCKRWDTLNFAMARSTAAAETCAISGQCREAENRRAVATWGQAAISMAEDGRKK